MRITQIAITNFRLLKMVSPLIEERTTVIVGRNNSGKTSLTELFRRLFAETSPTFRMEDFYLGAHEGFWKAFTLWRTTHDGPAALALLPVIEATITLQYDAAELLGPLGEFIIDLDPASTDAIAHVRYELELGKVDDLFQDIDIGEGGEPEQRTRFFRAIKERVPRYYKASLFAEDPHDTTNRKEMEWRQLATLIRSGFINAQRGLDDMTSRDNDVLGKIVSNLFETASATSAPAKDQEVIQKLSKAVEDTQEEIDNTFKEQLEQLLPALTLFGYPGLADPKLRTETTLDVSRLLSDHTKIRYPGANGVQLPEAYNGLGVRNLIFILLKLFQFYKEYAALESAPAVHLIFLEEPEAHLHPQMQEVFVSQLSRLAGLFASTYGEPWPVQFVITTHSSHIANKAPFRAIRYFLSTPHGEPHGLYQSTRIKDLCEGITGTLTADETFLREYMTLTRCDLFFADKCVLIEGASERLLLPKMIEKLDAATAATRKLGSQYVSIVEVAGSYAHKFFALLNFLELPTLVITDLDSVGSDKKACRVAMGSRTANSCIKKWFADDDVSPTVLLSKTESEKTQGNRRIAYQVPEVAGTHCGRSFEEAFILANTSLFGLGGKTPEQQQADGAWEESRKVKKVEFALTYAIDETGWSVPKYIADGLTWLAGPPIQTEPVAPVDAADTPTAVGV